MAPRQSTKPEPDPSLWMLSMVNVENIKLIDHTYATHVQSYCVGDIVQIDTKAKGEKTKEEWGLLVKIAEKDSKAHGIIAKLYWKQGAEDKDVDLRTWPAGAEWLVSNQFRLVKSELLSPPITRTKRIPRMQLDYKYGLDLGNRTIVQLSHLDNDVLSACMLRPRTDAADVLPQLPAEIIRRIMDFVGETEDLESEYGTIGLTNIGPHRQSDDLCIPSIRCAGRRRYFDPISPDALNRLKQDMNSPAFYGIRNTCHTLRKYADAWIRRNKPLQIVLDDMDSYAISTEELSAFHKVCVTIRLRTCEAEISCKPPSGVVVDVIQLLPLLGEARPRLLSLVLPSNWIRRVDSNNRAEISLEEMLTARFGPFFHALARGALNHEVEITIGGHSASREQYAHDDSTAGQDASVERLQAKRAHETLNEIYKAEYAKAIARCNGIVSRSYCESFVKE